jgi:hypothetical protein
MDERTENAVLDQLIDQIGDAVRPEINGTQLRQEEVAVIAQRVMREFRARVGNYCDTGEKAARLASELVPQVQVLLAAHGAPVQKPRALRYATIIAAVIAGAELGLVAAGVVSSDAAPAKEGGQA